MNCSADGEKGPQPCLGSDKSVLSFVLGFSLLPTDMEERSIYAAGDGGRLIIFLLYIYLSAIALQWLLACDIKDIMRNV